MPLYFFDTDDGALLVEDQIGGEFASLEEVKVEATRALAELARDTIPGSMKREVAVFVRDALGPVLEARMTFEAVVRRQA